MNIRNILKYFIYATAFIPLIIFSQYLSPFHFGKVVVFRSMVEFMLALYVVLAWRDPSYRPRRDGIFWGFLGFTLAYTLATFTSVNVYQSFWGTLERMGGLFSFWHYFAFYVILTSVLRTKEEWRTLFKLTVIVGILSAFYGFGQKTNIEFFIGSGGRSRIFGTIGNAALFAGYQILNVFLALVLGFQSQKKTERNLFFGAAAIMTLAVFMTAVRGSLLGISIGFLTFAFLYFTQTHSANARRALVSLLVLAVLFIGFAFAFKNSPLVKNSPYLSRVTNFSPANYTVQTRFWAWSAGLKGWRENPKTMLVGWGPENFNVPFSKYFNPKFFTGAGSETLFDRAHNMFVEVVVTMGTIGILAYLALFWVLFKALWGLKKKPEYRIAAIGFISMTIAYMIHNAFIFDTSANFLVFFTILGFISYLARSEARVESRVLKHASTASRAAVLGFSIIALIIAYQTNLQTVHANYATTRGIVTGWNNDFNGAVAKYKEAASYNVAGKYEYRNRYAQFLLDYSASNEINSQATIDVFKEAIALEEKNTQENPNDYLPELYLSRLNIILGKSDPKSPYNDEALKHSLKALSYSPTFVRTYYEIGQGYLNKHDNAQAAEAFQKAVDLNPEVGLSYWYLAAVYLNNNDVKHGLPIIEQAIAKGYVLSKENYFTLANLYIRQQDYPHLIGIYQKLIEMEPNTPQHHASLAAAYMRIGKIDDAVREAHLAAQADPSFEADAKKFVQDLGRKW
jgi:tetratricopeptide (TPR) repeat protein/O-antigen ligase